MPGSAATRSAGRLHPRNRAPSLRRVYVLLFVVALLGASAVIYGTPWAASASKPQCNNRIDDDGDGKIDYPTDPGCTERGDKSEVDPPPPPPPPPPAPSTRYTDVDFSAGQYFGEGVVNVFAAFQSDSRLSDWGGLPSDLYDSRGMTQDQNARVHLTHTPAKAPSTWASWQELRSTDGQWASNTPTLAKSSLNVSVARTWGAAGFSMGAERWFAWDMQFPLNINGVSFQFVNNWHVLADLHPASSAIGGTLDSAIRPTRGHPRWHKLLLSPNPNTTPYREVNLTQLTIADGSRVASSHNVWHELVVGMKVSDQGTVGNSPGWVEVWHNGVNVMPRASRPSVVPGESGPYMQLQNYTSYPTSFVGGATRGAIMYGGFRAGLTRADVQTR